MLCTPPFHPSLCPSFRNLLPSHLVLKIAANLHRSFSTLSYERALRHQPADLAFHHPLPAYALLLVGNLLVLSSTYALGITGTYLGDYFGILMDAPVTSFPFNLMGAPMYYGSTMSFLGTALLYGRPAGVVLSAEVLVLYSIALSYEEWVSPFHAPPEKNGKEKEWNI